MRKPDSLGTYEKKINTKEEVDKKNSIDEHVVVGITAEEKKKKYHEGVNRGIKETNFRLENIQLNSYYEGIIRKGQKEKEVFKVVELPKKGATIVVENYQGRRFEVSAHHEMFDNLITDKNKIF